MRCHVKTILGHVYCVALHESKLLFKGFSILAYKQIVLLLLCERMRLVFEDGLREVQREDSRLHLCRSELVALTHLICGGHAHERL